MFDFAWPSKIGARLNASASRTYPANIKATIRHSRRAEITRDYPQQDNV
jgi:hypothetical protein